MHISGFTTSPIPSIPVETSKTSQTSDTTSSDEAVLNVAPDTFSSLVQQAGAMPEVRGELVDAYKSRIASGQYPSQETVSGLADVLGGTIVKQATEGLAS